MKNYLVKIPRFVPAIYRNQIWGFLPDKKSIYLTFDDGPTPEITDWVLETLNAYRAKATFFCLGKNMEQHPDVFDRVLQNGHTIGNHTYEHLNGWNTANDQYFTSIDKTQELINSSLRGQESEVPNNQQPATTNQQPPTSNQQLKLFRPPYGKIRAGQTKELVRKGYHIVMWGVISADFDATISTEKCYHNVIDNTESGNVVVFHDSVKASKNLKSALPRVLEYFSESGFEFKKIGLRDIAGQG